MSKALQICAIVFFLFAIQTTLATLHQEPEKQLKPCKRFNLYFHDIIFNVTNADNATSSAVTNKSRLAFDMRFGWLIVFNDPLTSDENYKSHPVARAQGFYFYDMKTTWNAWFAFSIIFNSKDYKGTLNVLGADMMNDKTRDFSIVGGTGDFFLAKGIVTVKTIEVEGVDYFRVELDIKLYECY